MSVVISNRYWVCVYDELNREDIFNVRDDGTIEYGPNYTPEKAREAFSRQFGRPEGSTYWGWSGGVSDIGDIRREGLSGTELDIDFLAQK